MATARQKIGGGGRGEEMGNVKGGGGGEGRAKTDHTASISLTVEVPQAVLLPQQEDN